MAHKKTRNESTVEEPKAAPLTNKEYAKELKQLHVELVKLQQWVVAKGLKVCIVFEGRDGAGKGGTIKAITERVSPRVFRVVALPAPTEREKSQMYLQRYMAHFPAAGEVVIFDRSWYNRAGVERVMGFCKPELTKKFLDAAPMVERAMVESGIILLKYWLEVSPEEQERRLRDRINDGRKTWKLSPFGRQEARAPERDQPSAEAGAVQGNASQEGDATQAQSVAHHDLRLSLQVYPRAFAGPGRFVKKR